MDVEFGPAKDVEPGTMTGRESDGKKILVANLGDAYYAIAARCTHMGCTLYEGQLEGENVHCPCHGSTFNVKTGSLVKGPARKPEPSYKVRVDGGELIVSI